jgi:hypothetical protein
MVCVPFDHESCIRVAAPGSAAAPFPELADPEWIAWAKNMDEYYNLVELAHVGDLATVRRMLVAGACPDYTDGIAGMTPLVAAAGNCQLPMVRLLVAYGASVKRIPAGIGSAEGGTALHAMCGTDSVGYDHAEGVEVLMRAGCDRDLENVHGHTASEVAKLVKRKAVLKRLQALERKPYVGVVVKLAGLVGGAEHNGKLAFVLRALPEKERFELELIESGKRMDVRPANFVLMRLPEGTEVVTTGLEEEPGSQRNGVRGSAHLVDTLQPSVCYLRKHGEWPTGPAAWSRADHPMAQAITGRASVISDEPWPATASQVRTIPSWPRSWVDFSLLQPSTPTGMHRPTSIFWASLTPYSPQ